ncbi:oligosaccharide flippase family protein [Candidatus Gracilibacteria bacterium]|nr:oligosaccharide flippase family protein [Candidatus Gracilibacteria bacterium]
MKKNIVLYAFSTALNKGSTLLFFPILTLLLTLEEFGEWSLVISISSLLIPIISLNGSAAILREGSENIKVGFRLLYYFSILSVIISIILYTFSIYFVDINWLPIAIAIGSAESIIFLSLTYIRVQDKAWTYLSISLLKSLLLLFLIIFAKQYNLSLTSLLEYQFYLVTLLAISISGLNFKNFVTLKIDFKNSLLFSTMLIPHGISQWVMSSSDRLILGYYENMTSVGIYSLAYNIALFLTLINSGIGMAIPTYLIKDYQKWRKEDNDNKLIKAYTIIAIILYLILSGLYILDYHYFNIIGYYKAEMPVLIGLIYFSLYLLGLYLIFVNYLFFHRKSRIISKTTLLASILNIFLTVLLVNMLGTVGAAIGTLLAYIYYLHAIRAEALKLEPSLNTITISKPIAIFLVSIILISIVSRCSTS